MALICHYTRSESAIKILKSKQLWATDSRFLDDSKEKKIYLDVLKMIIGSSSHHQTEQINLHSFFNFMLDINRTYVCSFTEHKPNSSHDKYGNLAIARYFGRNDWVGIVFKKKAILDRLKNQSKEKLVKLTKVCGNVYYIDPNAITPNITLIEYIYKIYENVHKENLRSHFKEHWGISESDFKSAFFKKMTTLLSSFSSCEKFLGQNNYLADLILHQIMVKHICFEAEKEFRVTFQDLLDDQNCSEFTTLVELEPKPHLQFDFDYEDIEKIIIGPGQNAIITKDHLNEVLLINKDTSGLGKKILTSDIPWRT